MATSFQGTTTKCNACDKTVYLVDKLTADNRVYHKACFRCHHCKGTLKVTLSPSSRCWHTVKFKWRAVLQLLQLVGVWPCFSLVQLANYNSFEGVLYCRPHFDQLFKRTGSLDKSFEGTYCIISFVPLRYRKSSVVLETWLTHVFVFLIQELQRLSNQKGMLKMRYAVC